MVGIPVFFEVGFVLLIPIAFTVAKRTGTPMALVGLPMAAGLSVVHGLIPPHPAALLAVTAYQADIGRTILYGLIVGIPTASIAGPLFCKCGSAAMSRSTATIP
jgi:GntP family gluconate:H+ symporter